MGFFLYNRFFKWFPKQHIIWEMLNTINTVYGISINATVYVCLSVNLQVYTTVSQRCMLYTLGKLWKIL
jgi:hypothetical protein